MLRSSLLLRCMHTQLQMPKRLLLVRHCESMANADPVVYCNTPDWKIALTKKGKSQAIECGKKLRQIILGEGKVINENPINTEASSNTKTNTLEGRVSNNDYNRNNIKNMARNPVLFYVSPYRRAKESLEGIKQSFKDLEVISEEEDERLREQVMGNFQSLEKMYSIRRERVQQGRFFYRFPGGECGADAWERASSFLNSFLRYRQEGVLERDISEDNVIIVFHGLMLCLLVARWYKVPLEVLETFVNPSNGNIIEMYRDDLRDKMVLSENSRKILGVCDLKDIFFDGTEQPLEHNCARFLKEKNLLETANG